MSNKVPDTLRTGFDVVASPEGDLRDNPLVRRAASLVGVMGLRSAQTACVVVEHAGRRVVTAEDVNAAMKYHAKRILRDPGLEEDVDATEGLLFGEGSDSDDDESMSDPDDDSASDEEDCSDGLRPCACEVCAGVREAVDGWEAWAPEDPAEQYIKRTLDATLRGITSPADC